MFKSTYFFAKSTISFDVKLSITFSKLVTLSKLLSSIAVPTTVLTIEELSKTSRHPKLPNVLFPKGIEYTTDIKSAVENKDIIMLSGTLTITQSGTNRCKVISDGATINATINDSAMLEFELYQSSYATLNINSFGYAHVLTKENSRTSINGNDNSTIKLIGYGSSETNTNLGINSFINSILYDNAKIVNLGENNLIARQRDDSQIIYGENQGL